MPNIIRELEERIVASFVKEALAEGYRLAVSLERGYDVGEMLLGSTDFDAVMKEAFAGDAAHIFIQPKEGKMLDNGTVISIGWVYIVLGNDGWDVISDYSANPLTERLLTNANQMAEAYS